MREAAGIAAELNLVEQFSTTNAPFRPMAREIIDEIVGRAGLWRRGASLRRRREFQPFPDAARSEPGLSGDVADRGSGLAQNVDLIKDGLPRTTMCLLGQVRRATASRRPPGPRCDRHDVFIVGFQATGLYPLVDRRGSTGPQSFRANSAGDGSGQRPVALLAGPHALPSHRRRSDRGGRFRLQDARQAIRRSRRLCDLAAHRPPRAAPGRRLWSR